MTTRHENDLLTRTGPGTPMGTLMRRYWIPVLFSNQLAEPDGPPVRVKLLSEKLVAFRDSSGRVGLFDERCPHRGASMFFGRNEENGLRCVYHGWKFDVTGRCVDMPSEPADSNFRNKVSIEAYPCEEHGGVIWAYMGPRELKPAFPELEWTGVPASHRVVTRRLQESNWLQGYEGGWDTAHLPFLHRGDTKGSNYFSGKGGDALRGLPSQYELVPTDYGFVYGRGRSPSATETLWECALMFMPSWKMFQPFSGPDNRISLLAWVPQDDDNCIVWGVEYHPSRPLNDEEMHWSRRWHYIHVETMPGTTRPVRNRSNDYLVDRALQKSGQSATGIWGLGLQDSAIQESMGPIADRTREHLNRGDEVIIKVRNHLLKMLKGDAALPGLQASGYRVRAGFFDTRPGEPVEQALKEKVRTDQAVTA